MGDQKSHHPLISHLGNITGIHEERGDKTFNNVCKISQNNKHVPGKQVADNSDQLYLLKPTIQLPFKKNMVLSLSYVFQVNSVCSPPKLEKPTARIYSKKLTLPNLERIKKYHTERPKKANSGFWGSSGGHWPGMMVLFQNFMVWKVDG